MADNNADLVTLVKELGTGGDPITAVGADTPVTLRQAVAKIYWKSASALRLGNRPVSPATADDQFGHVLSTRTEGLINQALLQAIITKLNGDLPSSDPAFIDVAAIRTNVIRSLS